MSWIQTYPFSCQDPALFLARILPFFLPGSCPFLVRILPFFLPGSCPFSCQDPALFSSLEQTLSHIYTEHKKEWVYKCIAGSLLTCWANSCRLLIAGEDLSASSELRLTVSSTLICLLCLYICAACRDSLAEDTSASSSVRLKYNTWFKYSWELNVHQ